MEFEFFLFYLFEISKQRESVGRNSGSGWAFPRLRGFASRCWRLKSSFEHRFDTAAFTPPTPAAAPALLLTAPSPAPTPAPASGHTSIVSPVTSSPDQKSTSDSTPIVAGVLSAIAGVALVALAVFAKRRRASNQKTTLTPAIPPTHGDGNIEQGREGAPGVRPPPYSEVLAVGHGDKSPSHQDEASPRRHMPAEVDAVASGGIVPPSAPASRDGQAPPSAEHAENVAKGCSALPAGDGSAEKLLTATTGSTAPTSTANLSTAERDELSQFHQQERVAASISGGPKPESASSGGPGASSAADHNSADIGLGRAVLAAAQELVHHCQIPGVSEAASAVCMIANLVTDGRDNARFNESRLRQCGTVVMALKRAAKVADKVG